MNFKPDLARRVLDGTKTVTRRLASDNPWSPWFRDLCGYRVGQSVAVCPGRGQRQLGRAVVTSTDLMPLGRLTVAEARAEGFTDPAAFAAAWANINGKYDPAALVWRVGLRRNDEQEGT
jgi:hypothetical protein